MTNERHSHLAAFMSSERVQDGSYAEQLACEQDVQRLAGAHLIEKPIGYHRGHYRKQSRNPLSRLDRDIIAMDLSEANLALLMTNAKEALHRPETLQDALLAFKTQLQPKHLMTLLVETSTDTQCSGTPTVDFPAVIHGCQWQIPSD